MRKVRTRPWDVADYLKTDADIDAYLEAALEDGDPQLITAALGDIAKAKGMTKIATSPRPIFRKTTRDISHEDSISHVFSQGVSRTQQGGFTGSCGLGTGSNGHQRALCGRNTRPRPTGPLPGSFWAGRLLEQSLPLEMGCGSTNDATGLDSGVSCPDRRSLAIRCSAAGRFSKRDVDYRGFIDRSSTRKDVVQNPG